VRIKWNYLGPVFGLLSISAALAACGQLQATPPKISGSPSAIVAAYHPYRFQPEAAGQSVSFSIVNKPRWAEFSETTGLLSGVPRAPDTGEYRNIEISANDGTSTATLPGFTIEVTAPKLTAANSTPTAGPTPTADATI